jgi:hypothetical protein
LTLRSVATGVGVALAIGLPAVLVVVVVNASASGEDTPRLVYPFAVLVFVGMGVGGWVAASGSSSRSVLLGAVVGAGAIGSLQVVGLLRLVAAGDDVRWAAVPATTALGALVGAAGAALSGRWAGRTRS